MSQENEESRLLPSTAIPSISRGNAALANPANTDIERAFNYGSADLNGAVGLLLEVTKNYPVFLHDFIDFLIGKLNNDLANADTQKHIQQLKYLDKKIEPGNDFSIDSYNICIKVLKIIVFELNIFEEGIIDKPLLDKSLTELRIQRIEKPWREIYEKSVRVALGMALIGGVPALLAFLMYSAHFLTIPVGSNDGYQCFPCDNRTSCFFLNTQDNQSHLPIAGYTAITYISGTFELIAALPIGLSLFMCLSYLYINTITLNKLENLIENYWQYINRVAANVAAFSFLLFNIIVAPMAAYLYYRASDKIYYTYDQYMRYVNCSTQDSNLTLTFCHNFSGTVACNFNWSAAKQHFNNQNIEVFFDIGLSTALTLYSLLIAIPFVALFISKIKNHLNHHAELSTKAHVSIFASPDDIERGPRSRSASINDEGPESIRLVEMSRAPPTKITTDEINQMTRAMRTYRAPASI